MKFIWIDDNPSRNGDATNMENDLGVSVRFVDVKDKNLEDSLIKITQEEEPNLIIIDHNLEDVGSGIFKKGSSTTPYIKDKWPECPIICITGQNIDDVSSQQKSLYEEMFDIAHISSHYDEILSIAKSYLILKEKRPKSVDDLLNLLGVPEEDQEKLASILPTGLKESFSDTSLSSQIANWVRKTLLARPGFLYSKLWVSTLIGLKQESFHKVADQFSDCLYQGIFATDSSPRWWKSLCLERLYDISDVRGLPWYAGRGLPSISETDYSESYVNNASFPETVGYVDQTPDAIEVPLKIKESTIHPDFENMLFFEEIRIMKPADENS